MNSKHKYTDQNYRPEDSVCKYSCLSSSKKSRTLYNSLCHVDNRKHFSGFSLMQNQREASAHVSLGEGSGKNLEMFLLRKR